MSFLVDDTTGNLVRNLWPNDFKRFADDPSEYDKCHDWQAVPWDPVEISEWVQLIQKPVPCDRARPYIVANAMDPTDSDAEIFEVSLRIQGFLEYCNLGALGNWDGKEHSAPRATLGLVLGGGGYDTEWLASIRAVNRFLSVVAKLARPDKTFVAPFKEVATEQIPFKRRVFVKAEPGLGRIPKEVIHRAKELERVMNRWHLDEALEFGQLGRDGTAHRATQVIFNQGHFVDVTANVEVIINKEADAPVVVQLKPTRIVLVGTEGVRKGRAIAQSKPVKISKRTGPTLYEGWAEYDSEYIPSVLYGPYSPEDIASSSGVQGEEGGQGGEGQGIKEGGSNENAMDTRA